MQKTLDLHLNIFQLEHQKWQKYDAKLYIVLLNQNHLYLILFFVVLSHLKVCHQLQNVTTLWTRNNYKQLIQKELLKSIVQLEVGDVCLVHLSFNYCNFPNNQKCHLLFPANKLLILLACSLQWRTGLNCTKTNFNKGRILNKDTFPLRQFCA